MHSHSVTSAVLSPVTRAGAEGAVLEYLAEFGLVAYGIAQRCYTTSDMSWPD